MQEITGRIEALKDLNEQVASHVGKWVELDQKDAEALRGMNRKQRRAWLAEQRRNGRTFNETVIK